MLFHCYFTTELWQLPHQQHLPLVQDMQAWTLLGEICGLVMTEEEALERAVAGRAWLLDQTAARRTGGDPLAWLTDSGSIGAAHIPTF